MKYQLDITGKQFDGIDLYEGWIFFFCPPKLEKATTFKAWGVCLHIASHWRDSLKCKPPHLNIPIDDDDIYISGFSRIVIDGVVGGQLEVALYQPTPPPHPPDDFLKSPDGQPITIKRNWDYKKSLDSYCYEIHCGLDWPLGDCDFTVAAKGRATLEFHTEDCIPARQYVMDADRYGFRRAH